MKTRKVLVLALAIAVIGVLYAPTLASANLIGDQVTVTLVGADAGNNPPTQVAIVVDGGAPEFMWLDSITGCPARAPQDDGVNVDIGNQEIWVTAFDVEGTGIIICDSNANRISEPLTFIIEDMNWVGQNGVITGISIQNTPECIGTTTAVVLGPNSVQITLDPVGPLDKCHYDLEVEHGGDLIGGTLLPIDTTALLLAGAQMNAVWMIPVVLSGIGIGLFVVSRKSE